MSLALFRFPPFTFRKYCYNAMLILVLEPDSWESTEDFEECGVAR